MQERCLTKTRIHGLKRLVTAIFFGVLLLGGCAQSDALCDAGSVQIDKIGRVYVWNGDEFTILERLLRRNIGQYRPYRDADTYLRSSRNFAVAGDGTIAYADSLFAPNTLDLFAQLQARWVHHRYRGNGLMGVAGAGQRIVAFSDDGSRTEMSVRAGRLLTRKVSLSWRGRRTAFPRSCKH